jgi:ABC-type sugar transport system ATPase subunit
MEFGNFRGFEVGLREPGIAWVRFNQPERLNGMTHYLKRDLREALLLGDRIGFMDGGRLVWMGTPQEFRTGSDPRIAAFRESLT